MDKHLIVLVGLPGSGKSTFCKNFLEKYTRVSQDDQGKEGCRKVFEEAMYKKENIVIDRCNFNVDQRNRYLIPGKKAGYKTTIIHFTAQRENCIERISLRNEHPTLPASSSKVEEVVTMFADMFVAPTDDEADEVIRL